MNGTAPEKCGAVTEMNGTVLEMRGTVPESHLTVPEKLRTVAATRLESIRKMLFPQKALMLLLASACRSISTASLGPFNEAVEMLRQAQHDVQFIFSDRFLTAAETGAAVRHHKTTPHPECRVGCC
jgi:hypothetical protein